MLAAIFFLAASAYGLASALLLAYLVGASKRPLPGAIGVAGIAAALHLVHDGMRWYELGIGPVDGIAPSLSTLSLFVMIGFFFLRRRRPKLDVVGALVTPAALLMLLGSRAPSHGPLGGGAIFALHIGSSLVAMAALTVACGFAIAYLMQERQVKTRHLGALFHRLPPLEMLDTLAYRCVTVGLPALTLGIITGHIVAARGVHVAGLPWQQYFAMAAWVFFAAVLLLRIAAGWRGRRAAIGTIIGYASAALVLLFYTMRGGGA